MNRTTERDTMIAQCNMWRAIYDGRPDDAYGWVRLLCRRLRRFTVKQIDGPYDWV